MTRISALLLAGVAAITVGSAAHAADLIINEPAPMVGMVETGSNWDGAFLGVFAGSAWGSVGNDETIYNLTDNDFDATGWLLGVDAGVNFHLTDGLVAGIVGDLAWTDLSGSTTEVTSLYDFTYGVNWTGSLRGRLGIDGGAFMPYLTAGLAFANATATYDDTVDVWEDTQTHVGWTAGAGIEIAASQSLSIDLQYRYNDFGAADYDLGDVNPASLSLTSQQVTAGLHFRF